MSSLYSIDLMKEVSDALELAGFSQDNLTKLISNIGSLKNVKRSLDESLRIVLSKYIIDLYKDPFCPDAYKISRRIKGGQFVFDPEKIGLYVHERQKSGVIFGSSLMKELLGSGEVLFNANLLDFFLENQGLIPSEWNSLKAMIAFWGTEYQNVSGTRFIRYMYFDNSLDHEWKGAFAEIDEEINLSKRFHAAILI